MVMPTPASIHKAPFIWRKNYHLETALLDSSSESGSIFSSSRKSLLPLNRMKNAGAFANLRIISRLITLTFFCLEVLLKFRWTKEIFKILKRKKGGGGSRRREYAFWSCTYIEKVMQVDPGPVSVAMSPRWTVLLKSLFLLDNIWVWSHIPVFGHDEDSSSVSEMKGVSSCLRGKKPQKRQNNIRINKLDLETTGKKLKTNSSVFQVLKIQFRKLTSFQLNTWFSMHLAFSLSCQLNKQIKTRGIISLLFWHSKRSIMDSSENREEWEKALLKIMSWSSTLFAHRTFQVGQRNSGTFKPLCISYNCLFTPGMLSRT